MSRWWTANEVIISTEVRFIEINISVCKMSSLIQLKYMAFHNVTSCHTAGDADWRRWYTHRQNQRRSASGDGCNVITCVFSHAEFQYNCIGACTVSELAQCLNRSVPDDCLNTAVCMKPTLRYKSTSKLRFLFLCTNILFVQRSKSN
jgi:hypothetical protein